MVSYVSYPVLALSLIASLVLSVSFFPLDWASYRPEWMGLIVVYWVLRAPNQFGVIMAWMLGLLLDVLESAPLGVNALALAVVAFLVLSIEQRLRLFPVYQQCGMIFFVIGINQMLVQFLRQLLGMDYTGFSYLWPALTSALVWPVLSLLMDICNRRLG